MKRAMLATVCAFLLVAAGGAYLLFRSPSDLRFRSVKIIRTSEIPKIDRYSADTSAPIALVRFDSSENLARFGINFWHSGLFVRTYLPGARCQDGVRISQAYSTVADELGEISLTPSTAQRHGHHVYHIYVDLSAVGAPSTAGFGGYTAYDLLKTPQDFCFMLFAESPITGSEAQTNTVLVPKAALVNALEQYRNAKGNR